MENAPERHPRGLFLWPPDSSTSWMKESITVGCLCSQLCESQESVCACCRSDFPRSMSWFLSTVGAVAAWNTDHEVRSWMRERQEKFSSELSGFPFAVASLFSVRWIHISSLAFSWSLCSNSRHHQHLFSCLSSHTAPLSFDFPVHFKFQALPSPSPCWLLSNTILLLAALWNIWELVNSAFFL